MLTEIKVIDNFINHTYHKEILNSLESPYTDWYYQKNLSIGDDVGNPKVLVLIVGILMKMVGVQVQQ